MEEERQISVEGLLQSLEAVLLDNQKPTPRQSIAMLQDLQAVLAEAARLKDQQNSKPSKEDKDA